MSNSKPINVINYLLEVLNFNDYITLPENQNEYLELSEDEITSGHLTSEKTIKNEKENKEYKLTAYELFKPKNKKNDDKIDQQTKKNEGEQDIDVILMTKMLDDLIPDASGNGMYKPVCFFYIRAKLKPNNDLSVKDNSHLAWSSQFETKSGVNGCKLDVGKHSTISVVFNDMSECINYVKDAYSRDYKTNWDKKSIEILNEKNERKEKKFHQFSDDNSKEWIIIKGDTLGANKQIALLLERMKREYNPDEGLKLFDNIIKRLYINKKPDDEKREIKIGVDINGHVGQMKSTYPMAKNQRAALHAFKDIQKLENGEGCNVLAVSGPPGTGKTTMLQSIVADYIVRCAKDKKEAPVILISSANNKPVKNIIESFEFKDKEDILFNRWIKYEGKPLPLAVFMVSKSKREDCKDCFISDPTCGDNYLSLKKGIENIKKVFINDYAIKYAEKCKFEFEDLEDFEKKLQEQLCDVVKEIEEIDNKVKGEEVKTDTTYNESSDLQMISEGMVKTNIVNRCIQKFIKAIKTLVKGPHKCLSIDKNANKNTSALGTAMTSPNLSIEKDKDKEELLDKLYKDALEYSTDGQKFEEALKKIKKEPFAEAVDKLLDPSLRYKAFWLAVHYYETHWINNVKKIIDNDKKEERKKRLKELAMVCPCTVATFFKAPEIYTVKERDRDETLYGFADLLIVDEAGQVCPEIGLPIFALAKNAIVVGDKNQIPPVYNIKDRRLDKELKQKNYLDDNALISATNSSLMDIAAKVSRFNDSDGDVEEEFGGGYLLNEHFRCYNEIIEYCNNLIYKKKLKPKAGSIAEKRKKNDNLPAMDIVIAERDKCDTPIGSSSKTNDTEAKEIINWISKHYDTLRAIYEGKDIKDIICIITPFKKQADMIEGLLRETKSDLANISVGTVHTFQGAESPVVCFSTTYGKEDIFKFLITEDPGHHILNVAVSRAKEHFILFTSKDKIKDVETPNSLDAVEQLVYECMVNKHQKKVDEETIRIFNESISDNAELAGCTPITVGACPTSTNTLYKFEYEQTSAEGVTIRRQISVTKPNADHGKAQLT